MSVPRVCAHRGATDERPEQTMLAYSRAVELGADTVELDVRLTADQQLAVFHDATLERTTNGSGRVGAMSLAEVRKLDTGSWFDARFFASTVPTVPQVLEFAESASIDLCIEVKAESPQEALETAGVLAETLSSHGALGEHLISSFDMGALSAVRSNFPNARLLPWMPEDRPPDVAEHLEVSRLLQAEGVFHTASLLTAAHVREMQDAGLAVWVWSSDDPSELAHAYSLKPDVVSAGSVASNLAVRSKASAT